MRGACAYQLSSGPPDGSPAGAPSQRPRLTLVDGAGNSSSAGRRALVVDDEPSMRLLFRVNLAMGGYDVVEAGDAAEALSRIAGEPFDVILLDVMMPGMSGFELAGRLQADAATAHIPFVFVSARADDADIRRGLELGAADYIVKPFDPLTLSRRLDGILGTGDGA